MAQTAIQFAFVGMESAGYEEIKKSVVEMLKAYPKLNAKINSAKRRSEGKGLVIRPFQLDPEVFQALKTVGRAYTTDNTDRMHSEKAERLFQDLAAKAGVNCDVLDQIAGLMAGTTPFDGEGYCYGSKVFQTREAAQERAQEDAFQEMLDLHNQQGLIEDALNDLKSFAPHLEKLLRVRYIYREKITAACKTLGIQPRTQDDWHREAVGEIAPLLGIGYGY